MERSAFVPSLHSPSPAPGFDRRCACWGVVVHAGGIYSAFHETFQELTQCPFVWDLQADLVALLPSHCWGRLPLVSTGGEADDSLCKFPQTNRASSSLDSNSVPRSLVQYAMPMALAPGSAVKAVSWMVECVWTKQCPADETVCCLFVPDKDHGRRPGMERSVPGSTMTRSASTRTWSLSERWILSSEECIRQGLTRKRIRRKVMLRSA